MKKTIYTILSLAMCVILVSCQTGNTLEQLVELHDQYNTVTDDTEYDNDDDILDKGPVKGGTLKLFATEPDTLNPVLTKNALISDILGFVYEGMTKLGEDQKAIPVLSDQWSVSNDGLVWEFHIRDGVKWHDGEPFTAYDVEFTIQTILNSAIDSVYKPLLLNVSTYAAVDSSTIRIALKKPNSFMPEMMNFPILPKHQFTSTDVLSVSKQMTPVGTGPYKFDSYTAGENIVLKLNENWWQFSEDEKLKTDGMYIETIQASIYKSEDDAMAAFQAGDADAVDISVNDYNRYKGRSDLTVKKYTSRNFEFISFNLNDPVFSDLYARKAVSLAIDRDKVISEVFPGEAEEADLPILPSCWLEDETVNDFSTTDIQKATDTEKSKTEATETGATAETAKTAQTTQDNEAQITEEAADDADTPEEVLMLGGWKKNQQGYYKVIKGARRYLETELLVNVNNSLRVNAAQIICKQLEQAGIKVKLVQLEWNEMMERVSSGKYKMALIGLRVPQVPDISYLYSGSYLPEFYSPKISNNAYDVSRYSDATVNGYIEMLFSENTPARKKAIYSQLKRKILSDCPYIGLYFLKDTMIYDKALKGSLSPHTWDKFNDMTHWYKVDIN